LVGISFVFIVFPPWALHGMLPAGAPYGADPAQQIVAQRYFLSQPWHWSVLHVDRLMQPWGINLAIADGIPLAALVAKFLRPILPHFDQVGTLWLALCWALQPASAIFALRGADERRLMPAICVAILASCQPTFLARFNHASLSAHFFLLVLLGCYLRALRGSNAAIWWGCAVAGILLLVHPYLLFMGLAFPAATCCTLLCRGDRRWRVALTALMSAVALVFLVAALLGLTRGGNAGAYGFHTLNLAGLVYPARSGLFPGFPIEAVDATGGQSEGYAYLGAGLLLLLAVACSRPCLMWRAVKAHIGLLLACGVLTLLALSNKVYFFHTEILHIHAATHALDGFRASGRFIWVATYTLLVGVVLLALRGRPAWARVCLPLAALLSIADASALLARDRDFISAPAAWMFDPDRMRQLLRAHDSLTVLPPNACIAGINMGLMQPLWLAAETQMKTNTMYLGRVVHPKSCDVASALTQPPAPGELILVQPGFLAIAARSPDAPYCKQLGAYAACTNNSSALADLPPVTGEKQVPAKPAW